MAHPTVERAINARKAGQITGQALMRALVSFDAWSCPVSKAAVAEMLATNAASRLSFSRDEAGVSRLYLFSDATAVADFRGAAAANDFRGAASDLGGAAAGQAEPAWHLLETTGVWFFQLPFEGVDYLVLDPGSPSSLTYSSEQFASLARTAQAVEIERTLQALRAGTAEAGAVQRVYRYPGYVLAVVDEGTGYRLALAPDSRGRSLAAVFTAEDNFDAFCDEPSQGASGLQVTKLVSSGAQLFTQLARMQLDGVVFNCSGPAQPVAFAAALASVVLQAVEGR